MLWGYFASNLAYNIAQNLNNILLIFIKGSNNSGPHNVSVPNIVASTAPPGQNSIMICVDKEENSQYCDLHSYQEIN